MPEDQKKEILDYKKTKKGEKKRKERAKKEIEEQAKNIEFPSSQPIGGNSGFKKSLSDKYSILIAFKGFLILSMIGSSYYTIDWFITYLDLPSMTQDALSSVIKYYIIGYISSMFSMLCLIKMIDFFFDLDKKTNN